MLNDSPENFFNYLAQSYESAPSSWDEIGIVAHWTIEGARGGSWTLDYCGGGGVRAGSTGSPDCEIFCTEDDFLKIVSGELNPQLAFQEGRLVVAGKKFAILKLNFLFSKFSELS